MKELKFHLRQFYLTFETRKCRGKMDLLTYHCFRIYKIWEKNYLINKKIK